MTDMSTKNENGLSLVEEEREIFGVRDDVHAAELDVYPTNDGELHVTEKLLKKITYLSRTLIQY